MDYSSFLQVVLSAKPAFSVRSFKILLAIATPWMLCRGQRVITRLHALADAPVSRSAVYRFLSDGKFRVLVLFRTLFELIVLTCRVERLVLAVDDTLCPKWGKTIFGAAKYYDHVRRPNPGYVWGHNWVVIAVVVEFGHGVFVSLPFWISLYRSEKTCRPDEFKTRLELTANALDAVRTWFSGDITLLGDGAYNTNTIVSNADRLDMRFVSRLRIDAKLRAPNPPARTKKRGRPAKYGPYLPTLKTLMSDIDAFRETTVRIYGKTVRLLVRDFVAYWPAIGRTIRVVITRAPSQPNRVAVLSSTDISMSAESVSEWFSRRWSIEQLFSELKEQLGLDSAEVRKEKSVIRHSALCVAMSTWIHIWWIIKTGKDRSTPFSQQLSALRESVVAQTIFDSGVRGTAGLKMTHTLSRMLSVATAVA
jgi:hypothetical protein